jgi:hypothetical protein
MLTRMVQQEGVQGSPSPATDQLLRARPETTCMDFMLWVADQEAQAAAGTARKEVSWAKQAVMQQGVCCARDARNQTELSNWASVLVWSCWGHLVLLRKRWRVRLHTGVAPTVLLQLLHYST